MVRAYAHGQARRGAFVRGEECTLRARFFFKRRFKRQGGGRGRQFCLVFRGSKKSLLAMLTTPSEEQKEFLRHITTQASRDRCQAW